MPETTSNAALPRQPANGTNPPVPAEATQTPARQGRPAPLDWFRMAMTPLRRIMRRGA
jgi:hypothetical protein